MGVLLDVMTRFNSVPFRRQNELYCTPVANPMTLNTDVQATLSILLAINNIHR